MYKQEQMASIGLEDCVQRLRAARVKQVSTRYEFKHTRTKYNVSKMCSMSGVVLETQIPSINPCDEEGCLAVWDSQCVLDNKYMQKIIAERRIWEQRFCETLEEFKYIKDMIDACSKRLTRLLQPIENNNKNKQDRTNLAMIRLEASQMEKHMQMAIELITNLHSRLLDKIGEQNMLSNSLYPDIENLITEKEHLLDMAFDTQCAVNNHIRITRLSSQDY